MSDPPVLHETKPLHDTDSLHANAPPPRTLSQNTAHSPGWQSSQRETVTTTLTPSPAETAKPVEPSPTQSAVLEAEDDQGIPRYRGYTNPSSQSRSFKILQEKIDAGEGTNQLFLCLQGVERWCTHTLVNVNLV